MRAVLPKTNTSNSVTLNMYDKILTFCQKTVTPMHKVALSILVGCCASLNLSFLKIISDMSHRSGSLRKAFVGKVLQKFCDHCHVKK